MHKVEEYTPENFSLIELLEYPKVSYIGQLPDHNGKTI